MKIIKKIISIKISCLLVAQQSLIAGGITVDKTAPISNQANLESARNGVPVVNIVKANEKGLSHNKFSEYNVNKEGLILNNSNQREVNTQLAGYIYGNQNLKNGTAKTILNEVTSKNKSQLKGYTEVAGDRANVVVANPNGIYINGAGFINTSRATITTGNPNIKNGEIDSFEVRQGQIDIDGTGLNLSNVNKAELYAQTVKLNAKIHAQNLDVVTGKNSISKDATVTNIESSTDEKPTVSLDSSTLGGIYANKINLIGTQKGVGVNLPIEIIAEDSLKLNADGKIVLDKVVVEKDLEIKSNSSDVNSKTIYAQNVNIEAKNSIKNGDVIASKTNIDLKAKNIVNENLIVSGVNKDLKDTLNGNLTINTENLENKKTLYAKDNIDIKSKSIENQSGTIKANKNLQINTFDFKGDNSNIQASNIDIKANDFEAKSSNILATNGNLDINSNILNLDNSLQIAALDNINIISKDTKLNNSQIVSQKGNIFLDTNSLGLNKAIINTLNNINIKAKNNIEAEKINITAKEVDIQSDSLKSKDANIQALNNISIISKNMDNSNGVLQANKNLKLYTSNFKGDNSDIQASNIDIKANNFEAKSSNIVATNGNLDINSNSLNLDNSLQIASLKDINITSNEAKLNNSKVLSQDGSISFDTNFLELNKSVVNASNNINIQSDSLKNKEGNIQALKDINITSKNIDNENGVIATNENLTINSSKDGFFNNIKGILQAGKNLILNIFNIKADNSDIQASNIDIKANNFEAKSSNIVATNENLDINSNILNLNNSSQIASMKNLSITSNEAKLNNSKVFNQNGNITLNSKDLELNGSIISASKYLDINANSIKNITSHIEALNDINIISKYMDNSNGTIVTNENLNIKLEDKSLFSNLAGILQSGKKLVLDIFDFKGDNSKLQASNIDIKANNFEAKSSNIVATNGNLDINSNSLNLDNSLQIASLKDINITSNEAKLNNSKVLSQDGNISFDTNFLELNKSVINASNNINIQSDSLKNKDGNVQALKDINITSKNIDNENGVIATNENLDINSSKDGFFNNIKGILQAGKNLILNIFNIKADNSDIQASNIDIKANDFEAKSSNIVATNENLDIETNNFILENSYLSIKNNLNLNSKNSLNLKDNTIVANNLNLSANEIYLNGTSQTKNILYSTNDILINAKKLISNYLLSQANNNINIDSSIIDFKNSKLQSVAFIGSNYTNGYKQGDINLTTSNLNLYNTTLASKDINIKNQDNQKLQNLVVENSSLDVNNSINIATSNLSSKASKYLSSNNIGLNTDKSVVFLNNIFSGNNVNLTINENLTLDKSNSFLAQSNLTFNTKSLVNNAQFISNGNLTINTDDFIINNALLSSKNSINLNATNYILNNDSNEPIFGIRGAVTNLTTKLLTNYGFISSLYDMNIKVTDLINYAGIASANAENKASNINIEANNFTNYNTIYSNDNINLYIQNNLLNETNNSYVSGVDYARIYAKNNITLAKDANHNYANNITNKSAIIETQNGDINIWANTLTNRRILDYTNEAFVTTSKVTDSIYFEEGKSYPNKGANGIINNFFITRGQDINLYANDSEFSLIIDLAREPFSFHYATVEVTMDKKIQYDNPLYKASLINSGKNLNLNVKNINNQISTISAVKDINLNTENITNYYNGGNYTTNISFKTYHEREGIESYLSEYYLIECLDSGECIYGSRQKGTLKRGDTVLRTTGGDVLGNYDYGTYETTQSVGFGGTIIAGGSIKGVSKNVINGTVFENEAIQLNTYIPTTNTSVKTANIQTDKKTTENKNIDEKDNSSIKVENKLLNSNDIELKNNEKIKQNDEFLNFDDIKLKENKKNLETNIIVLNPIDENYILPTNKYSMFTTVNPNKNLDYLVESNPLYTNHSNFIGSSYFLEKLDFRGDRTIKRLGDAGYETKLVSDAIFNQTGQRFLSEDYTSENAQFVALMENAVNLSGVLGLELGVALTPSQLENLTQDIVWMEEKVVNGQTVLVPVVYLAKDYNKPQGATIQANSIDLDIKDSLVNTGTIKTSDYLNLNASSITNNSGVILSNGKATLISNEDFINKNGGLIKASDIQITSLNGSVINETYSNTKTIDSKGYSTTYTNIGKTSSIEATNGNLIIQAKNDITNVGANLKAKESVLLQTQNGDINLNAIKQEHAYDVSYSGGFEKAKDVEYQTSNVNANNILMVSGNNITLEASKLNANNQINLNAQNDVNIEALNNVYYRDKQTTKKGTFSKKTQRDMVYKESVDSAELNANDILINANNDVNLQAAKLKAQDNIIVNAKDGDVNIVAKEYREGELHQKSKSSWGGLKKSLDISSTDALKLNSALLETQASNVVLTSGKDINILASQINSGADIQLKALNDVLIASQSEYLKTQEVHKKSSFNLAGLASLVAPVDTTIYSSEIHKNDKLSSSSLASKLNANKDILIDSGSTTIVGSNLEANNIDIKADTGEINILSSQDVQNATSLDKEIKFGLANPIKGIVQNTKDMFSGETKVKFEVGSLTYDEVDKASQTTKNNSSNLNAKENLVLDSLTDINVQGSNLKAGENLVLNSTVGDINILNTTDTYNEDIKEKHAKASVNVTVQNEYVETSQAVKSAIESAEQLKQTKDDYSKYKGEVKKLENTLSDLKQRYKAKEVGIDYSDIEDLSDFIDNLKSQEKYYVAAIAAATADLASKTVAIATQAAAAASSSGTLGFSAGISLDVNGDKSNTSNSNQTSNASNLNGKNIYINTDEKLSTNVNVIGSNVIADENLYVNTNNLNVKASQDNYTSKNDSENINGSIAFTMYGGGGGTAGLGYGKSNSSSDSFLNNNSQLSGNNVNINVANDANFVGANVRANDTLNLNVGNNLVLESLRDEYSSNSKGFNVNAGVGFGSGGAVANRTPSLDVGKQSSTNAGFSVNNGVTQNKQTVLSSITGDKVNVNVGNNTHLKGSLLASGNYDENGNFVDNKNLNFTTDTLTFGNLSNSNYSSSTSLGANVNYNLEDKKVENAQEKPQQKGISSVGYQASNSLEANASKTLATLGQGNVTVKDLESSDELDRLNRDTENINKDLYSSKTGTSVDATLDTRLLTEDGRNQIKKEFEQLADNVDNLNRYLKDNLGNNKLTEDKKTAIQNDINTLGKEEALAKALRENGVSEEDIKKVLENENIQKLFGNAKDMPSSYDSNKVQNSQTTVMEEIGITSTKNLQHYLIDTAQGINELVNIVGEDKVAGAIFVTQILLQGAVGTAKGIVGDEVNNYLTSGVKNKLSNYIANEYFDINKEVYNTNQQNAVKNISDLSSGFAIDTLVSGGAFGIIKGAGKLGKANNDMDSVFSNTLEVGQVDSYKNLKKTTGDGTIDRDHQPSVASLLERAEQLKGSELSSMEIKKIREEASAVTVNKDVHKAGETYGGKNTSELKKQDASDLSSATKRDSENMVENAKKYDPENLDKYINACKGVNCKSNEDYDNFLKKILNGG